MRHRIFSRFLYLLLSAATVISVFSCSSQTETVVEETETEITEETRVYSPEDYAARLPEEYGFVNTDVPQVVIETDGWISGDRYSPASIAVISFIDGEVKVIEEGDGEIKI
nr:hypothetical protein [Clostridiales bacterium]